MKLRRAALTYIFPLFLLFSLILTSLRSNQVSTFNALKAKLIASSRMFNELQDLKIISASEWKPQYGPNYQPPSNIGKSPRSRYKGNQYIASRHRMPNGEISHVTFHYATVQPTALSEAAEIQAIGSGLWSDAMNNGWPDIAYHYIIGNTGTIYKGRADDLAPSSKTFYFPKSYFKPNLSENYLEGGANDFSAATQRGQVADLRNGDNSEDYAAVIEAAKSKWRSEVPNYDFITAQGVAPGETLGHLTICFLVNQGEPSQDAYNSAAFLCAHLLNEHGLGTESIRCHREVSTTTNCPGKYVYEWLRGGAQNSNPTLQNETDNGAHKLVLRYLEKIQEQ